ncbi:hypothetical protein LPTSP4_36660 [Leptospira ryugenii]|uniref:Uncharacterized protein n=1 Tax=Leptospira ryugenii TaxID=1917863 RepID=A0A2P2E5I2_9LEPT|nr:hypothetical protein LPTSP4_36660 [Leptospira ryugenii]
MNKSLSFLCPRKVGTDIERRNAKLQSNLRFTTVIYWELSDNNELKASREIEAIAMILIFYLLVQFCVMSYNELGYTTLSVAEPAEQALASARLLAEQEA